MNILFHSKYKMENFFSKKRDLNILIDYNIRTNLCPIYYCKSVEHYFWFDLTETEKNNDKSKEQNIVLTFAKYSGDNIVRACKSGIMMSQKKYLMAFHLNLKK